MCLFVCVCGSVSMWVFVEGCYELDLSISGEMSRLAQWGYFKFMCPIIKWGGTDMERPGITRLSYIYIYIHVFVCVCVCVFVCDLAKTLLASIDACYTKKNKENILIFEGSCWERERPVMLGYHIYINLCLCVSVGLWCSVVINRGSLSEVTREFMSPLSFCGYD